MELNSATLSGGVPIPVKKVQTEGMKYGIKLKTTHLAREAMTVMEQYNVQWRSANKGGGK